MSNYQARKNATPRFKITQKRLLATTAMTAAGLLALMPGKALADNWVDLTTTSGGTTTDLSTPNTTNIGITTGRAVVEGDLDINAGWTVNVGRGDLVAIDRENDPTYIFGTLNCAGTCHVLDNNGVFVGAGGSVDSQSVTLSTGTLNNRSEFINNGNLILDNVGGAAGNIGIQNDGTITAAEGGLAALVSGRVSNNGTINARAGKVAFAAGEQVTIDLYGDGLYEVAVEGEIADAVIDNQGAINAAGGVVSMDVKTAKGAVDNLINLDGEVNVASVSTKGGKIILSAEGADVKIGGKLDASGTSGGTINVTADNINVADTAVLSADGGKGGDQNGDGGEVNVIATIHTDYRGRTLARGGALGGNGGNAEISGYEYLGYEGLVDLSAANGETGNLLMDPAFAVIHSGVLNNPLGLGYVLSAQALANSMELANITVQADNFIDVGTQIGAYNTGNAVVDAILNGLVGTGDINLSTYDYDRFEQTGTFWGFPIYGWVNYNGTTTGNITLQSDTVNFNKDVIMGDGNLGVDGNNVNLNSRIYDKDGATALGDARLFSNAGTVNVISNAALIQQGIYLSADSGATVNVGDGTYVENVLVDKDLTVNGNNAGASAKGGRLGAPETIVQGNGGDTFTVTAEGVTIDGFQIEADESFSGVKLDNASFANVQNNLIRSKDLGSLAKAGVTIFGGDEINVQNNNITDFTQDGIYAEDTSELYIYSNNIQDVGRHGVYALRTTGTDVSSNMFNDTGKDGVYALVGDNMTVSGNMITDANDDGIDLDKIINSEVTNNVINGTNEEGIEVGAEINGSTTSTTLISGNTINNTDNGTGILVENIASSNITGNALDTMGVDGIRVEIEGGRSDVTEISYNEISNTYDDGIHVSGGAGATIYSNVIEGAGFNTTGGGLEAGGSAIDTDLGDGIKVEGVGLGGSPDLGAPTEYGEGSVADAAQVKIYDNAIAIVKGDGIDAENNNIVYVNTNLVGHADDHGININGFAVAEVSDNAITSVAKRGINVKGNSEDELRVVTEGPSPIGPDSIYAGIFGNKVLLAGGHGIYVSGVNGQSDSPVMQALQGNDAYGDYGWNVNIAGNEVVMTGNDGIFAQDNGSTRVAQNDVLMAGMGEDLAPVIDQINVFASFAINPPVFSGSLTQAVELVSEYDPAFTWNWGEGNGIYISGANSLGPNGWAIDVNNNNVDYTGGNGIYVRSGYNAIINDNTVNYAGVATTEHAGYDSMLDLLSSGPFAPEQHFGGGSPSYTNLTNVALNLAPEYESWTNQAPSRRNLWVGQDLTDTLGEHIIPTDVIEYQTADGIHVFDVRTNEYPDIFEGPYALADSEYNVVVQGNTISHTGDDGIDVNNITGRVLIGGSDSELEGNVISDAGYGDESSYGAADDFGADGISVRNVQGNFVYPEWDITQSALNLVVTDGPSEGPVYYGYAVDIIGNSIDITADDGIEVTDVASTLIQNNTISNVGVGIVDSGYYGYYGSYQPDGADGISVRNVGGFEGPIWVPYNAALNAGGESSGTTFIPYAVVVADNDIDNTGDDGIEVVGAGRTLITNNTIDNVGLVEGQPYYGGYYGYYSDGYGGDAIHVRNVYQGPYKPYRPYYGMDIDQLQAGGVEIPTSDYKLFAVDINHNVINRTGDDGIEVVDSGRTIIAGNEIADVGVNNEGTYRIAFGYSGTDIGSDEFNVSGGSTSDYYGNGADGISVRDVYEEEIFLVSSASLNAGGAEVPTETASSYDPYALVIVNNDIDRTGDDGIEVVGAGRTLIAGNEINNAGTSQHLSGSVNGYVSYTNGYYGYYGYYSAAAPLSSLTEFLSESGSMSAGGFLEASSGGFATDGYGADAIHVRGVSAESEYLPAGYSGGESGGSYSGYAADIIGNTINTTADDGIEVLETASTFISENIINNAGMGYSVSESSAGINGNYNSSNGSYYGYFGYYSDFTISGYGSIYISETTGNDGGEAGYFSGYTGGDAIHVENVGNFGPVDSASGGYYEGGFEPYAVVIQGNDIEFTADDGIEVVESGRTRIEGNEIDNVGVAYYGGYGTNTEDSGFFDGYFGGDFSALDGLLPPGDYSYSTYQSEGTQVGNISGDGYGNDAIHVRQVIAQGYEPEPYYGGDGYFSAVANVGRPLFDGTSVEIFGNTINNVADDGIQVLDSGNTVIGGLEEGEANTISNTGLAYENYFGGEGYYSYVTSGLQDYFGGDGIHVKNGNFEDDRKSVRSLESEPYFLLTDVEIVGNQITNAGDDGIEAEGIYNLLIDSNVVTDSGDEGILILSGDGFSRPEYDIDNIEALLVSPINAVPDQTVVVSNNEVSGSGANGLHVQGSGHESVKVFGNTFTDNGGVDTSGEEPVILGATARFESGQIDLTSDEEGETPNQIINTTGTPAVGLQFENAPGILPSELTIVDRTLGNTVFNGYTPSGSFYVRFENGAILEDDGSVIVIDGTDANFDGIRPATFPGTILPQATLDFIEDRLFDADDTVANGRGQIFVGFPPSITIENFEDFIRQLGGVPQDAPIANLQITGLPPVQLGPQGLNNIAPAGGEQTPEQLAGITPAAGGDDETAPQNIEPAAGGEDVSCWSDALNDAETGTITNYSFGGTFEDSIAANAGCGAQEG